MINYECRGFIRCATWLPPIVGEISQSFGTSNGRNAHVLQLHDDDDDDADGKCKKVKQRESQALLLFIVKYL